MSRELMPKSGIMMPHVVINRDAAVVGVSTVDGVAGAVDLTGKYLQKTDAEATYQTKTEGASKTYVLDSIQPIMEGALFKADPFVDNNIPFRSAGANGVESVDMIKVTPENSIKLGSYESSVQGVEIHSAGRVVVVDKNDSGVETKYPVYSKRFRPEIEDLPFAAIGSYVKDSKGRTIGVNRTGINSDIKQFTQKVTFQQPVTIADGVGDYDAVTMRQLRNSGGGSGGPTMSGISNYGIGDFHLRDSRAFIPAFEVFADGQLLSRTDYPDLWAYAQLLSPIKDSLWLGSTAQRGKYSSGNGTTTFRVPDRNGVQSGSIPGLFGRGDGGDSSLNGIVRSNAAPNITGSVGVSISTQYNTAGQTGEGAIVPAEVTIPGLKIDNTGNTSLNYRNGLRIDASLSNPSYGRDGTAEVRPNAFTGVWTIRAHGGFVAANTSWAVINSDQTLPPANTTANGGVVRSEYQVDGSLRAAASFVAQHTTRTDGSPTAALQIGVSDGSNSATWGYKTDGHITSSTGRFFFDGVINPRGNVEIGAGKFCSLILEDKDSADADGVGKWWTWALDGKYGSYFIKRLRGGVNTGQIVINMPSSSGSIALQGTSGIDFKHDIKDADLTEAMDRIEAMRMVNFIYNDDEENRVRFGIIAEEAELIAPQYIKHNQEPYEDILDEDGNKIGEKTRDRPSVDVNPIVMDLMGCVQALTKKIGAMEAEIAELKASK